jgi:hypothetical protein
MLRHVEGDVGRVGVLLPVLGSSRHGDDGGVVSRGGNGSFCAVKASDKAKERRCYDVCPNVSFGECRVKRRRMDKVKMSGEGEV